jgi:hypothetical protein
MIFNGKPRPNLHSVAFWKTTVGGNNVLKVIFLYKKKTSEMQKIFTIFSKLFLIGQGEDLPPVSIEHCGAVGLPGAISACYDPVWPGLVTMEPPVYSQQGSSPTWSPEGTDKQYARWIRNSWCFMPCSWQRRINKEKTFLSVLLD